MRNKNTGAQSPLTRRNFLRGTAAVAAGAAFGAPTFVPSTVFGSNAPGNRITIGWIGIGGNGSGMLSSCLSDPSVEVLAVCDVDAERLEKARLKANLPAQAAYNDFRQLLAREDIDAVGISTPDHWHVPIAVAAVKAGKDVYCQKPMSLTIGEGHALIDAVRRHRRILQVGAQQRSSRNFRFACELVRNGRIGQVKTIEVLLPQGKRIENQPVTPVPEGFDYDMWLGPAPWAPYTEARCHYNFRFNWDYSGGKFMDWGAHHMDIVHWALDCDSSGPLEARGRGDFPMEGIFNTPITFEVQFVYPNGVRVTAKNGPEGIRFNGTEGWVDISRSKLDADPKSLLSSLIGPNEIRLYESAEHRENFLECVRTRKEPISPVETGHRSASACHVANIALRLGRPVRWNPQEERFEGDEEANRMISRAMRAPWRL